MTARSAEHGSFVLNRTYPVPPARSSPPGPAATPRRAGSARPEMPRLRLDFRVGGTEINSGGPPGRTRPHVRGDLQGHRADERIVYGYTMDADGTVISVSVTTVEFTPAGDGTTLTFTEQGVFLDGADTLTVREKGTGELLDQLGTA